MHKIIKILPVIFAMIVFVSSCEVSDQDSAAINMKKESDSVYLEVDVGSVTKTGVNIRLVNKSPDNLWIGSNFSLSDRNGEPVKEVPSDKKVVFPAEATMINAQSEVTFFQSWGDLYGALPPGEYFFLKDYSSDKTPNVNKLISCSITISDDTADGNSQETSFIIIDDQPLKADSE